MHQITCTVVHAELYELEYGIATLTIIIDFDTDSNQTLRHIAGYHV